MRLSVVVVALGTFPIFREKRHDNKILKVQILLSRNFVVVAQAPIHAAASSATPAAGSGQAAGDELQGKLQTGKCLCGTITYSTSAPLRRATRSPSGPEETS